MHDDRARAVEQLGMRLDSGIELRPGGAGKADGFPESGQVPGFEPVQLALHFIGEPADLPVPVGIFTGEGFEAGQRRADMVFKGADHGSILVKFRCGWCLCAG